MSRPLWLLLGLASVAAGVAGAFLPLLPTTPFLLLAAFAFSRSSERLHAWLVTHPRLGPPVADWGRHGAIRPRNKLVAVSTMAATWILSAAMGLSPGLLAVQALVLLGAGAFVWSRPEPHGDDGV